MIRRPPRSTQSRSSAASDVYKQKEQTVLQEHQASLQRIFNETGQLVRYGGGQHSLETAIYWSQTIPHGNPSLSDQIEKEIVQTLIANPVSQFESLDRHLCRVC